MTNTNTKEFMAKVQSSIIDEDFTKEDLKKQVDCLINNRVNVLPYHAGAEMVQGGYFDCYYSQVAETMANWFDCTVAEIWAYYKNNEQKLWTTYKHIMAKNIECIYTNKRCYI